MLENIIHPQAVISRKQKVLIALIQFIFICDVLLPMPANAQEAAQNIETNQNGLEVLEYPVIASVSFDDFEANKQNEIESLIAANKKIYALSEEDLKNIFKQTALKSFQQDVPNLSQDAKTDKNLSVDTGIKKVGYHIMTAYNSLPNQTDDSPCITANGFNVCKHGVEDTVAANFLKFNTRIRIPDLFGDRVFIVRDRMNTRYPNNVDVWMVNYDDAKHFGRRVAKIEILN